MSVSLKPVESLNVGVLGLGGEGANIVQALDFSEKWSVDCQIWDSCANTLSSVGSKDSFDKKILGVGIAHGLGCVGQYELGRSIFLQDQELSKTWLEGKNVVILAGALGGGFAGGFAPEFARLAKSMGVPCLMFGKLPFSFEGRKRIDSAKQALGKLRELCLSVPMFEGDDYLQWIDEEGFAQGAVKVSTEECALAIQNLVHMLVEDGIYDFDLATVHSTFDLDVSKTIVVTASVSEGDYVESALDNIVERISQKLPDREVTIDRLLISVVGEKSLPVSDVSRVNKTITEHFHNPGKTYFGACINPEMSGVSIVAYISIHLGAQFELSEFASENGGRVAHPSRKSASKKKVASRKKKKEVAVVDDSPQEFFDSILNESNRGYFDDTPSNSWNGIDLDVPTYIRRGIRIKT